MHNSITFFHCYIETKEIKNGGVVAFIYQNDKNTINVHETTYTMLPNLGLEWRWKVKEVNRVDVESTGINVGIVVVVIEEYLFCE